MNYSNLTGEAELVKRPLKFEVESSRETWFNCLSCTGFLLIILSLFLKFGILYTGIGIVICGVFGFLRSFTDDYFILNEDEKILFLHNNFFFFKSVKQYCPLNTIKSVNFSTSELTENQSRYDGNRKVLDIKHNLTFSITLDLPGPTTATLVTAKKISIKYENNYEFNEEITELRDFAVDIANMAGCPVVYSDKIPQKERLQPACTLVVDRNQPAELEEKQSDFTGDVKQCPSCGRMVSPGNKFCIDCGREV